LGLSLLVLLTACGRIGYGPVSGDGGDVIPSDSSRDGAADSGAPDSAGDAAACDVDGDGYAAISCGGVDCDDSNAAIAPGAEGPLGDATCSDAIDNDCDGDIDGADSSCQPVDISPLGVAVRPILDPLQGTFASGSDRVYFAGDDGSTGVELWVSDGTRAGTHLVHDVNPAGNSDPRHLRVASDKVFFFADDGTNGLELWVTDGTSAGTLMVRDIHPSGDGLRYHLPALAGDLLVFQGDDGVNGREPWVSDGTAAGTHMIADLTPGAGGSQPYDMQTLDAGSVVFRANVAPSGIELWRSDGTAAGTTLIADANPGAGASLPDGWFRYWGGADGVLYYRGTDGTNGLELWRTDGTEAGTLAVSDIEPGAGDGALGAPHPLVAGGRVFFTGTGPDGVEPYVSDGTPTSTRLLADLNPTGDSNVVDGTYQFTESRGLVFFTADDGMSGREPWVTDGSATGTRLLRDIRSTGASDPYGLFSFRGELWFSADDGSTGVELWKSDGTRANTVLARDFNPGGDGIPFPIGVTASWVLLAADGGGTDGFLWVLR